MGNFSWLVAEKGVRLVLSVGVGFWVARYLGPERFGILNYGLALVGLVSLLAELGLENVVRRDLIRTPGRTTEWVATSAGLRLAGGVAAYGVLAIILWRGGMRDSERMLVAVLGLTLFQPAFMVADLWFQARLQARFTVWAQGLALAVGAGVRVALIVGGASLTTFAWAVVGEAAIACALVMFLARRAGLRWPLRAFDGVVARQLLREAWPLLLSGIAVMLYLRIDVIMLRRMVGEAEVGIYAAATRFTEIWYFLPVALASSALPSLLRAREKDAATYRARLQTWYDLNAGLAYVLAVGSALAAPWLIRVAYGPAFAAAEPVLV